MSKKTYRIKPTQIVSEKRGWVTFLDAKGTEVKARKSQIELIEGSLSNRRVGNRRYDCRKYTITKSADGHFTMNNGDEVATKLHGKEIDEVYKHASSVLQEPVRALKAKYANLNLGMQRMCLGNRIRGAMNVETETA